MNSLSAVKMSLSMLCSRLNKKHLIKLNANVLALLGRYQSTDAAVSENEEKKVTVAKRAVYPEILDLSRNASREREQIAWHEEVKKCRSIEEKLIKVNMPKYYGWKMMMLNDHSFPYNSLPYIQHYTRTQFEDGLPTEWNKHTTEELDAIVNGIRDQIEDAILFHYQGYRREYEHNDDLTEAEIDRQNSLKISTDINRVMMNALYANVQHLNETMVDLEPRHEAFWFVGGIEPIKDWKTGPDNKWACEAMKEISRRDRPFQYEGKPLLALRNRLPLEPVFEDVFAPTFTTENLPHRPYDPIGLDVGFEFDYQHGRSIPGFWPGSEHEFGQLSYHDRSHMINRNKNFGEKDSANTIHAQAILAGYSWLLAQACYQGFSTFNDITYPLTTQTIITDGRIWSFYVYQLNTTTTNNLVYSTNPKVNKCWGSSEMKLFESIDSDGKVIGLNDDVIRNLVQFYMAVPKKRDYDMSPYLDENESVVADIEHTERRVFLENAFKYINSKRPRHRILPEIYLWEKIYKIEHKTRPMDARRKYYELNINPWNRRLNEHTPKYIPRAFRRYGRNDKKNKWEATYWP